MASKPIRVVTTKAVGSYPKGAELGFDSEAKAASVLGEGSFKVISHQDGSPVDTPKPSRKADDKGDKA